MLFRSGVSEKTSVELPKLSEDCTHFELLKFIKEFNEGRQQLNWTTGEKLQTKFRELLTGTHRDNWDVQINALRDANSNVNDFVISQDEFFHQLDIFLMEFFSENDYHNQVKFLRNVKKPPNMSPTRFKQLLDIHNSLLRYFAYAPQDAGDISPQ